MTTLRVLNGRYELGDLLGRGGMADVYKARDTLLGRTVAVKLLRTDLARDAQLHARFKREAQAVAGLNHPSIVAVYDTGEHATEEPLRDGARVPFIVMELVTGKTLRELVRGGHIGVDQAIDYTLGVLSALEYSHRAGIVHRDIKPANVMVTEDTQDGPGTVKVMDFGIARTIADSAATMTQTQTVIGTAQYLSPEQARGEMVDERSDLYSAGCLFYELLAGRPPFVGDSPVSVAYQHVREQPVPASTFNPDVNAAIDSVLARALQKDRADRFQNAAAFRRALRAARTGVALGALPAAPLETHAAASTATAVVVAPITAAHADDDGPATRAMAKVMAGGALTTEPEMALEVGDEPGRAVRRRRRAWIATLFVFLALVLVGGGLLVYNWLAPLNSAPVTVQVPSVAGMAETDAMAKLSSYQLDPHPVAEFDPTVPEGEVIGTDPAAGSTVDQHATITVMVSKGSSVRVIPKDITGKLDSEARQDLATLGLLPGRSDIVDDPKLGRGLVVTTDPAPGMEVAVGTTVNLKVSSGQVPMPSLVSKSRTDAVKAVEEASPTLHVTVSEVDNAVVKPGTVTGQSIQAGSEVDLNSTITITVAKAPPTPSPTPSPTPTPTPTPTDTATRTPADGNN
ncbi:Stk1 family PASTA domain-containing Ser/Thr kinase [Specibacter cremeus]|uniref:Stk1 family PASTA domain-containing Ser/Thr kinase n=1 Tax=Specibacter cremeus TaxID=1629051 RepID=UPI000F76F010|nr:Stk1 family PASTA domain-containing Ser/Thr kinase [Specibacter cremeus]